jgi:hypothetical protein
MWRVIIDEASAESKLWETSLRPEEERELLPIFSELGSPRFALGLETIYEGYLVHYGSPRLFDAHDDDTALLLGDYLYAHGLLRIAAAGDVVAVADLSELISLCGQLRAADTEGDGPLWAATAALLGNGSSTLDGPRAALRLRGDPSRLEAAARAAAGNEPVERALAAHALRLR